MLVIHTAAKTMSSREIAELTGKDISHIHRDIRTMLEQLGDDAELDHVREDKDARGYTACFHLTKSLSMTLVAGYNVKLRKAIIDRWQELEAQQAPAIPNFSNPAEAARAWALEYEARVHAEATKAQIGQRREATAMNTASQAVKKAQRLEVELDKSMQYATVKRMEMLYHGTTFSWRLLKNTAAEMQVPAIDVFDANYGTVKAYHASVWREAYAVSIDATTNHDPVFSRAGCAGDKTELRGLAPTHLAQALDAIAMLKGMDRNTYVVSVLEAEVKRVAHEASFLNRVLRGNPYLTDSTGGRAE